MADEKAGLTGLGKLFSFLLILVLFGVGGYVVWTKMNPQPKDPQPVGQNNPPANGGSNTSALKADEVIPAADSVGPLAPAALFVPKDGVITIELSEYAGYAGLIVANNGLDPNPDSLFTKKYGLKVKLTLSEDEPWSNLNSGKIAGSATTVDVLSVYAKQLQAVVPVQIGFSRGADGLVVRKDIKRVNQLKGKTIAAAQFNESDFLVRYLAQEAGLGVKMLNDLSTPRDPEKVNVLYCRDAFAAGELFARDLASGTNALAGCMTWDPTTTEVANGSDGKAHILFTNRNLLIVADVLVLNKPWAQANPDAVKGLVAGLLEGNRLVRNTPDKHLATIGKAFKWDTDQTKRELSKVHLSNLPENLAFFAGTMDSAGSYAGIFQMAVLAYGPIISDPVDSDYFASLNALKALEKDGFGAGDTVQIAPIRSASRGSLENDPLLSKDIRFFFQPNSSELEMNNPDNIRNFKALKQMLQVSPGSTILLRGHVDPGQVPEFRKQGGEPFVREMALKAMDLSKKRAEAVQKALSGSYEVPAARLNVIGRGWEEPVGTDMDKNRRVEAQWFTLE